MKYKTREEILNAGLPPYEAAKLIEQLAAEEAANPRPIPPLTTETRQELEHLKNQIIQHRDRLALFEKAATAMEPRLTEQAEELRQLSANGDPDSAHTIQCIVFGKARLQLMQNLVADAPARRSGIESSIRQVMQRLDAVLGTLAQRGEFPHNFFDLQNRPVNRCSEAIAIIDAKLKT